MVSRDKNVKSSQSLCRVEENTKMKNVQSTSLISHKQSRILTTMVPETNYLYSVVLISRQTCSCINMNTGNYVNNTFYNSTLLRLKTKKWSLILNNCLADTNINMHDLCNASNINFNTSYSKRLDYI